MNWDARLQRVRNCHSRIAGLDLSAFGRAFASNGYAISQLLFQAEFAGLSPPAAVTALLGDQARLVDRGLPPAVAIASGGSGGGQRRRRQRRRRRLCGER